MKKFIAMLLAVILCCSYSPVCVKAVETVENTMVTSENSPELWERFLKYDLCILDYNLLTDEEKELCKFIFESELNSEDTIICERARRILAGYDVGRRVTLEDTENYYDFADFNYMYSYLNYRGFSETPYLCSVPDIKHIDYDVNYNEYWLDDTGSQKILSTEESFYSSSTEFLDTYKYVEQDENGNIITEDDIKRYSIHLKTIKDETFTYAVYPDDTLYVMKANEHLMNYEIPEEVDGMKVVGIKAYAFKNEGCYDIIIPESVEYIEPLAFAECTSLENIILPENLKFIGRESFILCNSLKNITADCPNLICESPVFGYCNAENAFINFKYIPSCTIISLENIDNLNFGDDVVKMGTICANSKFMKDLNYTIPETVKFITNDIFAIYNDYYSDDLIIPETVKVFGAYSIPASGKYQYNLISGDGSIAVVNNKCYLSPDTVISGYYGTEAYNYSIANNLTFNPLDTTISDYYGTDAHNYALAHNIRFSPLDDILYGDANGDGKIAISDMVSLQKYLLNNGTVGYEADVNKDGRIDVFDMVLLRKQIIENNN